MRGAPGNRRPYRDPRKRRTTGPRTRPDLIALVVDSSKQNPTWGYTRIRGAMKHLGHDLGRNTIKRILKDHGIEPAPERGGRTPWKTFLQAHWEGLAAADFFTVEVMTLTGLVRYLVFFVERLSSRTVEIAGITSHAYEGWMLQVGRNLTDVQDGFLRGVTHLVLDRDPLYTKAFRRMLHQAGVKIVRLPRRSPNLNAYAERFVLTCRSECLARITPLGETHLRSIVAEFLEHYHGERPHQAFGNDLLAGDAAKSNLRPPWALRDDFTP